jgi:hypothetical protein
MYKFSVETFAKKLRKIPEKDVGGFKIETEEQHYLYEHMIVPIITDENNRITLDLERFDVEDLREIYGIINTDSFDYMAKGSQFTIMFTRCVPAIKKAPKKAVFV